MKFVFKLESLLKHRKSLRNIAQRNYAEAQQKLRDQLKLVKNLYESIDATRKTIEITAYRGGECTSDLNRLEDFINGTKIKIEFEKKKARDLMQVEEQKHELLVEAMKEFRSIEILKEKRKQEFKKEKNKKLAKTLDNIAVMRHRIGSAS